MNETMLAESTLELLAEPWLGKGDIDSKVRYLLEGEYMRRMIEYLRTDRTLAQKYGMTFEEFMAQRVVQQRGYTWEVEKDAMDWALATDGIKTTEGRLRELRGLNHVRPRVEDLLLRYSLLYPSTTDY